MLSTHVLIDKRAANPSSSKDLSTMPDRAGLCVVVSVPLSYLPKMEIKTGKPSQATVSERNDLQFGVQIQNWKSTKCEVCHSKS